MLNIHLNGEIVSCPDTVTIKERLTETRAADGKCKFGEIERYCTAWRSYVDAQNTIKPFAAFGNCHLSCSINCPHNQRRREIANIKKSFAITPQSYRRISSASHYMLKTFQNKNVFFTLTFPPFKKYLTLNESNRLFSKFIKNLRQKHGLSAYVAVRERGTKNNRLHFHVLANMPFISFTWLNNYWCSVIGDYCQSSSNAVQTDPKTKFIHNPVRAMRYVCKYFSKAIGTRSESRVMFISNNLLSEKYETGIIDRHTGEIEIKTRSTVQRSLRRGARYYSLRDYINRNSFMFEVKQTSDFTTRYRVKDEKQFIEFCKNFIYPLFDLSGASVGMDTG